ncbi:MAG: hypothetical protein FJ117_12400 [Deltaproteobacteria bacterium]|nr:hypothetical protein [Deltaproteobacteria bacterium]
MGGRIDRLKKFLQDFLVGLTSFEIEQTARHEKLARHDLFMLLIFGEQLGIPILPPFYSLRIFPHVLPALDSWKRRMLREHDLTEMKTL